MNVDFSKMHGLGNDFVVIDDRKSAIHLSPEDAEFLCNRHLGIGADGVMLVRPPKGLGSDFSWVFFNADGSIPEMCGNGIRCFARFLVDKELVAPLTPSVTIDTARGPLHISIQYTPTGAFDSATVAMGYAELTPALVPTTLAPTTTISIDSVDVGACIAAPVTLEFEGKTLVVPATAVSMGNPHAVVFCKDLGCTVNTAPVKTLGPVIECAPEFPAKTNVEFVDIISRSQLSMRVWERACGETMACGTGACAVAVSSFIQGFSDPDVTVQLLGGQLSISVDPETLSVLMTGPATLVFDGSVSF